MNAGVVITEEQLALRPGQRALIAAQLANVPRGHKSDKSKGWVSNGQAAKLLNVHQNTVVRAKMLLRYATPDVIKAVEEGRIGVHMAHFVVEKPPSPDDNAKHVGKNPARIERERQTRMVWKLLREALIGLSSLPRAADVAVVARHMDRHKTILPKVPGALNWLKEFADVFEVERAEAAAGKDAAAGCGEV